MGVCCIVFDTDGMLLEFFMNFLNIEKNKILRFIFQYFMFSSRHMLFPTLKNIGVKKNVDKISGGGGGCRQFLFLPILSYLISRLFSTFKKY